MEEGFFIESPSSGSMALKKRGGGATGLFTDFFLTLICGDRDSIFLKKGE
jgi:hypothetical protein